MAFPVAPEVAEQVERTESGFHRLDRADRFSVETVVSDANAEDCAGPVPPGGVANPDFLRTVPERSHLSTHSSVRAHRWPR